MTGSLQDQLQRTLGEGYVLERELGGGGMSRVFVATESALRRRVVVKVLPPEVAGAVSTERFRREIQLAASLQHPHIVPVFTAGASEGLPYFTMPFQAGESLRTRLARDGALPIRDVLAIMRDVAQALAYAHAHGVVHRDIKPENIMLTGGVAMVTDFGVAKALSAAATDSTATGTGLSIGTPAYMPPEQGAGDPQSDQRADLYALGAVAYEMLCGEMLFAGRTAQQMMLAHAVEAPRPVTACRAETPPALAALVMRCLEKDPAGRPASAREVLSTLEAPAGRASGAGSARRRPIATLGLAVALGAVVAAGAFGIATLRRSAAPATATAGRSIAVLAFENTDNDKENEYFSDGMAEELMTQLSKVPGLRVAARTSAFAFKGKNVDARQIGRELNVGTVLEGSVRKSGNRMRVNARLVDATTGYQLWSDEYQRNLTDVFAVQDEVTRAIVNALELHLSPSGGEAIAKRGTTNVDAFNLYLQGRFFFEKRTEDGLNRAVQFFTDAIARDPGYAAAYAGLADSYLFLAIFGFRAPSETMPLARKAAERSIALDSLLAEGHTSVGLIELFYDWDFMTSRREFERSIALNPQYAPARLFIAWNDVAQGDLIASIRDIGTARQVDPLSLIISTRAGTMWIWARQYDSALVQLRRTLEMDSTYALAHVQIARAYLFLGNCSAAITYASKSSGIVGGYEASILGYASAVCGDRARARAELADKLAAAQRGYVSADMIAKIYAGLGDAPHALDWLERAYQQRTWSVMTLQVEPMYNSLRQEPRFRALVEKMHLPCPPQAVCAQTGGGAGS